MFSVGMILLNVKCTHGLKWYWGSFWCVVFLRNGQSSAFFCRRRRLKSQPLSREEVRKWGFVQPVMNSFRYHQCFKVFPNSYVCMASVFPKNIKMTKYINDQKYILWTTKRNKTNAALTLSLLLEAVLKSVNCSWRQCNCS